MFLRCFEFCVLQPTDKSYFEQPFRHGPGDEISSKVISGFTIPVQAIFDEQANVAALQALMAGA